MFIMIIIVNIVILIMLSIIANIVILIVLRIIVNSLRPLLI